VVKIVVLSEQGKEAVIAIVGPDEFFGRRLPHRTSTTAVGSVVDDGMRDHADQQANDVGRSA
jgi:hypothetical protein